MIANMKHLFNNKLPSVDIVCSKDWSWTIQIRVNAKQLIFKHRWCFLWKSNQEVKQRKQTYCELSEKRKLCFPDSFAAQLSVDQWNCLLETSSYFEVWCWRGRCMNYCHKTQSRRTLEDNFYKWVRIIIIYITSRYCYIANLYCLLLNVLQHVTVGFVTVYKTWKTLTIV